MIDAEKDAIRERIAQWDRAAPVMQRLRDEDIRAANTAEAIEAFDGFFKDAARHYHPLPTSGLIEQQRWFAKLSGR